MKFRRAVRLAAGDLFDVVTGGLKMFANAAASWHHSNRYNAQSACEHCGGIVRHERWCITCDALVQYAYNVVIDSEKLNIRDRLILHALGVSWTTNHCERACVSPKS